MADTLVVICAIMKPGEGRYMLDALRWAHVLSQKGVNTENIHLFVNEDRILEVPPLLTPLWRDFPDARFPITSDNYKSLFETFHKGDHQQFLPRLLGLANAPNISRVTIVLINHGSSSGRFGNAAHQLERDIVQKFQGITKPTLVVCSACYADKILTALEPRQDLLIIWDKGTGAPGVTYNWGVVAKNGNLLELGTQLCYWVFDVLYDAREDREIFMNIIQYAKQTKLECVMELCGNIDLLIQPFFGPHAPDQVLLQFSVLGIILGSQSPSMETKRPQFKDVLTDLVDNFLTRVQWPHPQKSDFWEAVYNPKFALFAASKPGGAKNSLRVGKVIEDKGLTDECLNGAALPDVLVTYDLVDPFISYLNSNGDN